MTNLVLVESPTKAKTLARFLGPDYHIEATMGHVRDLPEKKLGIEIKENSKLETRNATGEKKVLYDFIPQYQAITGRKAQIASLKKMADSSEQIILATDPDREGEAIAWHIAQILKLGEKSKRIVFHEITKSAIDEAIANPRTLDMLLVNAQQARRILDRLVGYKLSPVLWNKLGKRWLSAGRVQTVAVRLIVDREREILAFKSDEYWLIEVELSKIEIATSRSGGTRNDRTLFVAKLVEINSKKAEVKNKEQADEILGGLKSAGYIISNIEKKETRRYPYPPFTTSTLQQAAANRFFWTAKRTMRAAQSLYEKGFITYHRTDSTNLSTQSLDQTRKFILDGFGSSYLPPAPKLYKTKSKVAQEAHEAIRPTNTYVMGSSESKILSGEKGAKLNIQIFTSDIGRDGELLYSLIWKRFVSSQMSEAVFDRTIINIIASGKREIMSSSRMRGSNLIEGISDGVGNDNVDEYLLGATGQVAKFDGWLVFNKDQSTKIKDQSDNKDNDNNTDETFTQLPELTVGEKLNLLQVIPAQKFTQPPPRYNEASLIKILEEKGIGRPSTYAPIISTIETRKYVEKFERKFNPTDLGMAVVDFLVSNFSTIFDISFTASMEDELDEIANGKFTWQQVLNDFYTPFISQIDHVFKNAERVKMDLGTTEEKCPDCKGQLIIRLSKYGKFLACSNFPTCKYTKNMIEKSGLPCPKCGGDILVKKTRFGKQFYGCGNYPKCTFAAWKKEDIK